MLSIFVDTRERQALTSALNRGAIAGLHAATGRGAEIMREEVPEREGTLKKGIKPHVDEKALKGTVEASAVRPAQPARVMIVNLLGGRTREIKFNAQPEHDYAIDVAEGTGIYGARGQEIRPKKAKKLRFVIDGREVFASSIEGQQPNPYPERTADRLEVEVDDIVLNEVERVLGL